MSPPFPEAAASQRRIRRRPNKLSRSLTQTTGAALLALLSARPTFVSAQSNGCVSLQGSKACSAFSSASVNLNDEDLTRDYPFLQYVTDRQSFDDQLHAYVKRPYVESKFVNTFGCDNVDLANTNEWYARFTRTVICNVVVQRSIESCGLSGDQTAPLCAEECASFAQSEAYLTSDQDLCSNPSGALNDLIVADFTTCSLPQQALGLGGPCISALDNEPENCGYGNSTMGLCSHCSNEGDLTDRCCDEANASEQCENVEVPAVTTTISLPPPTATPTTSSTPSDNDEDDDGGATISGGAIAGIVIGALAGIALIALALFFCLRRKRNNGSQQGSIFNQPTPARQGTSMTQSHQEAPQGYEVLPGGRIARMSALEGHSGDSSSHRHGSSNATGTGTAFMAGSRKATDAQSSSSEFGESPGSRGVLRPPPTTSRRNGSLSSNSVFGSSVPQSPTDGGYSSPQAVASQQSEQLPFFKDYYSQEDIHPGDRVAVLWAYQPRASDEFALERGDMLKVVGIWDDGWATGVIVDERADEWEARRQAQRDSGVSNASGRRDSSPAASGEIKAFPLVCVCLPDHWRKTIEGDGSTDT